VIGTLRADSEGQSAALAINEKGQVTGWADASLVPRHGFIWLPRPDYELAPGIELERGIHDLDPAFPGDTVGNDINDAGMIAGTRFPSLAPSEAFRWTPPSGPILGLGSLVVGGNSFGLGITNELSPLRIVGTSDSTLCGGNEVSGFLWTDGPTPSLTPLTPPAVADPFFESASVTGINELNTTVTRFVSGWSCPCTSGPLKCQPEAHEQAPVAWSDEVSEFLPLSTTFDSPIDSQSNDVNDSGEFVGFAKERVTSPSTVCLRRATYWSGPPSIQLVDLGMLAAGAGEETVANAISNSGVVVGTNETEERAILWNDDGAGWSAIAVDALVCECYATVPVIAANDVNDRGWIVGVADVEPGAPFVRQAVVLAPFTPCDIDLDASGMVGFADLQILLQAWGPCSQTVGRLCLEDFDCNCSVGQFELTALLDAWGSDPCGLGTMALATAGPGIPPEMITMWVYAGGGEALAAGQITPAEVAACMSDPDPQSATLGLLSLLAH